MKKFWKTHGAGEERENEAPGKETWRVQYDSKITCFETLQSRTPFFWWRKTAFVVCDTIYPISSNDINWNLRWSKTVVLSRRQEARMAFDKWVTWSHTILKWKNLPTKHKLPGVSQVPANIANVLVHQIKLPLVCWPLTKIAPDVLSSWWVCI